MTHASDLALLHLDDEHSLADLKESFRHIALELHPDMGGDRDRFEAVRDAYERLLPEAEARSATCQTCKGKGSIVTMSGFHRLCSCCPTCMGAGKPLRP